MLDSFGTTNPDGSREQARTAVLAKEYAQAAALVGKELNLPVIDVWAAFMARTGWVEGGVLPGTHSLGKNMVLEELMTDGMYTVKIKMK